MLRILLIILVALAVIIGLMRLTGSRTGDTAPAAAAVGEPAVEAAEPAADLIIDEPAVDTLEAPAAIELETGSETLDPALDPAAGGSGDSVAPMEEGSVEAASPAPDNAALPAADPAPAGGDPVPAADPNAPGR